MLLGWALGLAGLAISTVSIALLMRSLFQLVTGRGPRRPPSLVKFMGGALAGFALFGAGMWLVMNLRTS